MYEKIKQEIIKKYNSSPDIITRNIKFSNEEVLIIFINSLCDDELINKYILKNIINIKTKINYKKLINNLENNISGVNIKEITKQQDIYKYLNNGFTIVFYNKNTIAVETKKQLFRSITKPINEQTISGPKDAFNEDYMTNIGLIRKRIKSTDLVIDETIIGKKTKSKIGILYLNDIAEKELINEVKKKINEINIDAILDSTYIREIIVSNNGIFPMVETTERPDLVCMSLIEGKICVITENSSSVLIIPTFFIDLFHSPEDYYQKPKNVTVTRLIRLISFLIAIILPAFYIAITTFNHETIPLTLIINFAAQRDGVPFPAIVEALGMTIIFEILRESDIRMPSVSGSAISILGAIVLGDAAVSAGIVSPIMVIVIAISSICSLMFPHIAMVNAIRIWKIVYMLFAATFGIIGIVFASFLFLILTTSLKSFGKPYLYPLAPISINKMKDSFIAQSIKKKKENPILSKNEVLK